MRELVFINRDFANEYHTRIYTLFCMLDEANAADSDNAAPWQKSTDASQRGYYGHLSKAIQELAGDRIYDHFLKLLGD
jgi:hypothetical protein